VLEETAGVVSVVLEARTDAVLEDAGSLFPGVGDSAGPLPGTVQLWPHLHRTDAMFLALLRRR
jgi:16S rRNA (cytosine967-C5)-methyltransferase